jgi:hypothetical protein
MPFAPGDPWPGSAGGACSPYWGGYVTLFVRAAISAGNTMHAGPHVYDRLDAGNVLGGGDPVGRDGGAQLWVDISRDVLDVELAGGASSAQGIFSKPDAATVTVTLADPDGDYDPLNPDSPYAYGNRSRLVPGIPVEVFAEVIADPAAATPTVTTHYLFTGTADSWGEEWTPRPNRRHAVLIASDATKTWTRYDRPEQPPEGEGDTVAQRVTRLVDYYGWLGTVEHGAGTVTLQATTLASAGWELLNRTLDDELGTVYFTPAGALRWLGRATWDRDPDPVATFGCDSIDADAFDVLVDASPSSVDTQLRNSIYAARSGGTTQTAVSESSVAKYGPYEYKRTDLGLATDAQAAEWATHVLQLYAWPQITLDDVTMRPALAPQSWECWAVVLGIEWVADAVRVLWAPPDFPDRVVDVLARVVGTVHNVTRTEWETEWVLVNADPIGLAGVVMHAGPHAQDRLDAGFVLA